MIECLMWHVIFITDKYVKLKFAKTCYVLFKQILQFNNKRSLIILTLEKLRPTMKMLLYIYKTTCFRSDLIRLTEKIILSPASKTTIWSVPKPKMHRYNFYQKPINRLLVLTGEKVSNSKQVTSKRQTCY